MQDEGRKGLLSIIIPTYNRSDYLLQTLSSVEASTYRPVEVIVIDDGSTDDTLQVVQRWIVSHVDETGNFVCHFIRQENRGVSAARNMGFRASVGEFIHFLDSDDVPVPVMYERQVDVLQADPDCDYVWSGWRAATDAEIEASQRYLLEYDSKVNFGQQVATMPYAVWPGLFRRRACGAIGDWDESLYFNEDWDYSSRFLCLEPVIRQLPNSLMVYRQNGSGTSLTARASTEIGNESVLRSIQTVEDMIPRMLEHHRVVIKRVTMMYYTTLLCACKRGYKKQKGAAIRRSVAFLWRYKELAPRNWSWKLLMLCFAAYLLPARAARGIHVFLSFIFHKCNDKSNQWFA